MTSFLDTAKGHPQSVRAVRRQNLSGCEPAVLSSSNIASDSADLLCLEDFSDAELLSGLWARYERQQIYTWLGDVLVSVNPYSNVGAFDEEVAARYTGGDSPQAPHLYAVVRQTLAAAGKRHALLITGESGAGKTEATRAVLSFLAKRHPSTTDVQDRLLRSTPVLEAFGNAHTRQNANSSRFGKFIEVHLAKTAEVVGATLRPYMLEASRVSGDLPRGERTYHIFYLLKAALNAIGNKVKAAPDTPFWDHIVLQKSWIELAHLARELMQASGRLRDGPSEAACLEWFEVLVQGLQATGMTLPEVAECCRLVAAVALLSDPELGDDSLTTAAKLLRVEVSSLQSFLWRTMMSVGGERVFRERNKAEASTLRASLAQELYATLFSWLTRFIAKGIAPPEAESERMLGLLDLYGFEVFPSNGFEQFLINYCNERLQQFFNRQVFAREAEEYAAEGLDWYGHWSHCAAACQLPALALLEGRGNGPGIFHVINDRSKCNFEETQTGSNNTGVLAETLGVTCASHVAFCRASGRDSSRLFGVKHFAGQVFYEAADFVRKNASAHRPDICAFLREHGGDFVREMLSDDARDAAPRRGRKLFGRTLIDIFQQELNELCSTLEARDCRHIRCLRPNDEQKPLAFDDASMLRQCRYSGLLEATRIRRQGFAHRRSLSNFAARYASLLASPEARTEARQAKDLAASCKAISEVATAGGVSAEDVRIGHSKVFMREPALAWLEGKRSALAQMVLSSALRGHVCRRRFRQLRWSILRLQAMLRGSAARRLAASLRQRLAEERAIQLAAQQEAAAQARALIREDAAVQLQSFWRSRRARGECNAMRTASSEPHTQREWPVRVEVSPLQEARRADELEASSTSLPPRSLCRRHVGEVRVCVPTCRQGKSRPLAYHEIVAGTPRISRAQESTTSVPSRSDHLKVRAYPATALPGGAQSAQIPRTAAVPSQSKMLREVSRKTRSTSSIWSPRSDRAQSVISTPARGPEMSRAPRALVASPVISGISTTGGVSQRAQSQSSPHVLQPRQTRSFTPPGVVVPAWAWPSAAITSKALPIQTPVLKALPTPNRSRSQRPPLRVIQVSQVTRSSLKTHVTNVGPPLRATLSGPMPTAWHVQQTQWHAQSRSPEKP